METPRAGASASKKADFPLHSPASASTTGRRGSVPVSPSTPSRSTLAKSADRLKNMFGSAQDTPTTMALLDQKMRYYETMRVHMKRVQYTLLEEKRNSFYKELLVYLLFLAVMMMTVCTLPIQVPFEHNEALNNVYLDQEFNNVSFKKNFYEVDAIDEMWQWFTDVLLDGYYNSGQLNTRRVTSIQIRSARMMPIACSEIDASNPLDLYPKDVCYQTFEGHKEDTTPYGNTGYGAPITYEKDLTLLTRSLLFTPSIFNARMDYGHGGYTVYLPRDNATAGAQIVEALKSSLVLPSTRYVAATWALYNPSSNVFTHLQVMFEISPTDHIELTQRLKSFRVLAYKSFTSFFTAENVLMIFLTLVALWFTHRELESVFDIGIRKYTQSMWNVFDLIQIACLYALVYKWFRYLLECHSVLPQLQTIVRDTTCSQPASGKACFVDLDDIGLVVQDVTNISACVALVSVAIVFKYLRLNARLNMLWTTLRLAAKDLIAFVIIFIFIFFGYAVMGFLLFGSHVRAFRSVSGSLAQCFQMILGAFDFDVLSSANPALSGLFFFSFMIFVFLIVVNMFIAILSEYYSVAQDQKRQEDESKKNILQAEKGAFKYDHVEYDVLQHIAKYWNELRWRVKLPPRQRQLPLLGQAYVLLVDYNYLMAERARLRAKFRTSVRVICICLAFLRPLRKFFLDFDGAHLMATSLLSRGKFKTLRTKSSHHVDYRKFPVTYIPLHSKSASAMLLIDRLKPGDVLEFDDGSDTLDRIGLEVLGPQDHYLADSKGKTEDAVVRPFGLQHTHDEEGRGSHIKCCRVLYQGDTVLVGSETCSVSNWIWIKYLCACVAYGFMSLFSSKTWRRKTRNTLISDDDISQLLEVQLATTESSRGQSCRFDELVRQFRHFLAKKARNGAVRIPNNDLETCAKREAIAFVERFSKALIPLDKRELGGYKYVPMPTDTSSIRLPNSISRLSEFLAHNAHEVWSQGRISQGWRWGPHRDNEKKLHPDLIAYEQLSEEAKQYDRETSMEALKVIQALGYTLQSKSSGRSMSSQGSSLDIDVEFGAPVPEGETYVPKPICTDDIELPADLRSLVELLAENTHDIWAKKRMEEGWVYGPKRNDAKKEHDGLVPYVYLTSEEKDMDRNTAIETIKCILRCGFILSHKQHNQKPKFNMFGRSEDVKPPAHLNEATGLAMGVNKAKNAFMQRRGQRTYGSVTFSDTTPRSTPPARAVSLEIGTTPGATTPLNRSALPPTPPTSTPSTPSNVTIKIDP